MSLVSFAVLFCVAMRNSLRIAWTLFPLVLLAQPSIGIAAVWRVESDGSGDFSVIQEAVDAAASGDTIRVGVGRFDTMHSKQFPGGGPVETVVWIDKGPLTFIGQGQGATILGPAQSKLQVSDTTCVSSLDVPKSMFHGMTFEHLDFGILGSNELNVQYCEFRFNLREGLRNTGESSITVENCHFEQNDKGIRTNLMDSGASITSCSFRGNTISVRIVGTEDFSISNCTFQAPFPGTGIDVQQGAAGLIESNKFTATDPLFGDITVVQNCTVEVRNNIFTDSAFLNLRVWDWSTVSGSGNRFGGGDWATIELRSGSVVSLTGNDILHGNGPTVRMSFYGGSPTLVLDFEQNHWGTSDAALISSWIIDGNDDPGINAFVDFEPFLELPISSRQRSIGSLKARYDPGN